MPSSIMPAMPGKPNVIRFGMYRNQGLLAQQLNGLSADIFDNPPSFEKAVFDYIRRSPLNANRFPQLSFLLACLHTDSIFQAIPHPNKVNHRRHLTEFANTLSKMHTQNQKNTLEPRTEALFLNWCNASPVDAYRQIQTSSGWKNELNSVVGTTSIGTTSIGTLIPFIAGKVEDLKIRGKGADEKGSGFPAPTEDWFERAGAGSGRSPIPILNPGLPKSHDKGIGLNSPRQKMGNRLSPLMHAGPSGDERFLFPDDEDCFSPMKSNRSPRFQLLPSIPDKKKNPLQRLLDFEKLEAELKSRIFGQDQALGELLGVVDQSYVMETPRFKERFEAGKPRSVVLLVGPSGVGKTQTVEILKKLGNRDAEYLDGSNYSDDIHANKIMGSGPGYVGYDEPTVVDSLIDKCKAAKIAGNDPPMIVIDELDKAAPRFFTIWNDALSEGRMERQQAKPGGRVGSCPEQLKVDFRNMDIVCTANFAQQEITRLLKGKDRVSPEDGRAVLDVVKKAAFDDKGVNPDFWGRFTKIIPFKTLSAPAVKKITESLAERYKAGYLSDKGVQLEIHPDVLEKVHQDKDFSETGCRMVENELGGLLDEALREPAHALIRRGRWYPVCPPDRPDHIGIYLDEEGRPKAGFIPD